MVDASLAAGLMPALRFGFAHVNGVVSDLRLFERPHGVIRKFLRLRHLTHGTTGSK